MDRPPRIRTVNASRYVTPLREGGSLPAIIEADDDGMYVLKFRGAGQGPKALIAELLAGEIGRLAGLPIPEIVFVVLPPDLARTEPDAEIQSLIGASGGLNLALDYLPGSVTFDSLAYQPDAKLASAVVWFDAFVCNVDRTARNVNMLMWHRRLWLIDHGAALYFQHAWNQGDQHALTPFPRIVDHVLLKFASGLKEADAEMKARILVDKIADIVKLIPDAWLADDPGFESKGQQRDAYLNYFTARLASSDIFVKEALRARASHL
ncbi:MAG TPA: HipA family kinase [Steroidobacteraceae bacterium]